MTILRIILLLLLFLVGRRLYRAFRTTAPPRVRPPRRPGESGPDARLKDLTDQEVSDADFEEIP